jgi:hypothetical protein
MNSIIKFLKHFYKYYLLSVSKIKYFIFLNKKSKLQTKDILSIDKSESQIDLVTIAFNNPLMIEYQIKLLRKNITDKFTHIIADNSSDFEIRNAIHLVCISLNVSYVSIPKNDLYRNKSHGGAMHWVYKNVIKKRNNEYFGFLDHDIFPTQPYSIINKIKKNIYGRVIHAYKPNGYFDKISDEHPYWSLWAGFYFLKSDLLFNANVYKFDFNPRSFKDGIYLDTAGGLWDPVMSKLPYPGQLATYSSVKFRDSEVSNIHTDYYEQIDDWVHFVNISNWYKTPEMNEKNIFVENFLSTTLNQK